MPLITPVKIQSYFDKINWIIDIYSSIQGSRIWPLISITWVAALQQTAGPSNPFICHQCNLQQLLYQISIMVKHWALKAINAYFQGMYYPL